MAVPRCFKPKLVVCAFLICQTIYTSHAFITKKFQITNPGFILDPYALNYPRFVLLRVSSSSSSSSSSNKVNTVKEDDQVPSFVRSPVLRSVYPAMIRHKQEYGHPNIPLGNNDGKRCKTLRRLQFEGKLMSDETLLLEELGFRFNSFEDVYDEADFDDIIQRLLAYEAEHKTNFQIPKKYAPDPELGAWVTVARRIGRDNIDPRRREVLDGIGFAWVSTRKCGSSFMKNYRPIRDIFENYDRSRIDAGEDLSSSSSSSSRFQEMVSLLDPEMKRWLNAQRLANEKSNLSKERISYLDNLSGFEWRKSFS